MRTRPSAIAVRGPAVWRGRLQATTTPALLGSAPLRRIVECRRGATHTQLVYVLECSHAVRRARGGGPPPERARCTACADEAYGLGGSA